MVNNSNGIINQLTTIQQNRTYQLMPKLIMNEI